MNLLDYFKLAFRNKYLILFVSIICLLAGYLYTSKFNDRPYQNTLFLTFGIQEKTPNPTTSPFENLEAADQITESIQGWFKDPGFTTQIAENSHFNYALQSKKQEKNNLIVEFNSSDLPSAQIYSSEILSSLNQRLSQYNSKSDLQINIATSTLDDNQPLMKSYLIIIVSFIIGLIIGFLGALFWEFLHNVIQSDQQLELLAQQNILASFKNDSDFKNNYFFLSKFLNDHFSHKPLQIIDLTHKNKFGLETISKHTQLAEIKTLKLPIDFHKVSAETATLIIVEIGYSKIKLIQQITKLKPSNLVIISLQKVSK